MQFGLGDPIPHQTGDIGAGFDEGFDEPCADEAGAAGHKGGPVAPK